MDCLPVHKQNYPEIAPASLRNSGPKSNPPVGLDMLMLRAFYCPLNPFVPYLGTIGTISSGVEVAGRFHTSIAGAA